MMIYPNHTPIESNSVFKKVSLCLVLFGLFLTISACGQSAQVFLKGYDQLDSPILLSGYDLFETIPLSQTPGDCTRLELKRPYQGFALLQVGDHLTFPLLLNGKSITMSYEPERNRPLFLNNPVNERFYNWLERDIQLKNAGILLDQASLELKQADPLMPLIQKEKERIDRLATETRTLPSLNDLATRLLESRLLVREISRIESSEQVTVWKDKAESFIRNNKTLLRHTDAYQRLVFNWFMLAEIQQEAGYGWEDMVAADMRRWIAFFEADQDQKACADYILNFYLNRRMVTMAATLSAENKAVLHYRDGFRHSDSLAAVVDLPCRRPNAPTATRLSRTISDTKPAIIALADANSPAANAMLLKVGRYLKQHPQKADLFIASSSRAAKTWVDSFTAFWYTATLDDQEARDAIWPGPEETGTGITFIVTNKKLQPLQRYQTHSACIQYFENE
jgi:hypothetical protein